MFSLAFCYFSCKDTCWVNTGGGETDKILACGQVPSRWISFPWVNEKQMKKAEEGSATDQ